MFEDIEPLEIVQEQAAGFVKEFIAFLPQGLAALLFLCFTWLVVKLVRLISRKTIGKSNMRPSLKEVSKTIITIAIWVFGILIAATIAMPNLTPAKILAGLGLGSIAVGLAFKDIFENFIAGIMILLREPMRLGDYIEINDVKGQVKKITIRDTYIRQTDGELVMLPNAMLFKNPVHVLTDWDTRRVTIMCGVAYDEDVDKSREVIRKAVENTEYVNKDKPVQIFAQSFGSSSIDFEVTWWTGSKPVDERQSKDNVVAAVKRALDNAGIEIPFPYRTLTFKENLTIAKKEAIEG